MCEERQSTFEATKDQMQALIRYLPDLVNVTNKEVLPTALAQAAADIAVSPQYAKATADLYKTYGPTNAETAARIDDILNQAASERELRLAEGTGKDLVNAAVELQKKVDPTFYSNLELLGNNLAKYLELSNPNKISDSELEAMRRGMGRTPVNPNSAIDTAARAMLFGEKGRERIANFGNAITQVAATLPQLRTGIPAFEVATRRQVGSTGNERTTGVAQNTGQQAYSMSANLLDSINQLKQKEMAKQRSLLENVAGWSEIGGRFIGSIAGGMMCWVAREAFGHDNIMWVIWRDEYLLKRAPAWFVFLYLIFGKPFSLLVRKSKTLKQYVRNWMIEKLCHSLMY